MHNVTLTYEFETLSIVSIHSVLMTHDPNLYRTFYMVNQVNPVTIFDASFYFRVFSEVARFARLSARALRSCLSFGNN
jgi:hypothetical protein